MRKNSVEAGYSFAVFAVLDNAKSEKRLLERTGSALVSMKDPHN
jgi:hypothetical protein